MPLFWLGASPPSYPPRPQRLACCAGGGSPCELQIGPLRAVGGPGAEDVWPGGGLAGAGGWGLTACPLPSGHSRADGDCGDERTRHREERLLGARLDRDQEKLLR